ncbi:MAG: hypothetical protein A4E28_01570 [Methanocella sp. PtaU1.Bin125]|nr:MAG: hypothetical protein A4E28_01570 [Methanocella sp. PtaU1.Bin125]
MNSPRLAILFALIAGLTALAAPAGATYSGDRPLASIYRGEINGDFLFSMGDSVYTGSMSPGSSLNVTFDVPLPQDAVLRVSRLYVYWTWSNQNGKGMYPNLTLSPPGSAGIGLGPAQRFMDNKGFASAYDYYVGTDAYNVTGLGPGARSFTVRLDQDGPEDSTVAVYGMGLLLVYESPSEPRRMLWVSEGCDLLYSSYGISPAMATAAIEFPGDVPVRDVARTELYLVAPSGGYSTNNVQGRNSLLVNQIPDEQMPALLRSILSILFPNYRGKAWTDAFDFDQNSQVGVDRRDITPFLRSTGNRAEVRDSGDYFQLSNAVLSITMKS